MRENWSAADSTGYNRVRRKCKFLFSERLRRGGEDMAGQIDLRKTVYELCSENPEIMDIMNELGFKGITNPAMLRTVGRYMTIPKGAAMKGIDLEKIKETFRQRGYDVIE